MINIFQLSEYRGENMTDKWREYILKTLVIKYCRGQRKFYTKEDFRWPVEEKFPNECDKNLVGKDGTLKWKKDVRGRQQYMAKQDQIWLDNDVTPRCWRINPENHEVKQLITLIDGLR